LSNIKKRTAEKYYKNKELFFEVTTTQKIYWVYGGLGSCMLLEGVQFFVKKIAL